MDNKVRNLLDRLPRPRGDRQIMLIVAAMLTISVIEVFSASSRLTFGGKNYLNPILSHGVHIGMAVILMYVFQNIHFKKYKFFHVVLLPLSIGLLGYLFIQGLHSRDAQRWIDLGLFQLQPSELAKISVVLTNAFMLAKLDTKDELSQIRTFRNMVLVTGIVVLLIVGENLSTALIIGAVTYSMMIIGGISGKRILGLTGFLALAGGLALAFLLLVPKQTIRDSKFIPDRASVWQTRVKDMFSGSAGSMTAAQYSREVAHDNTQVTHARIAVASSGIIGKLPGNSRERDFLQEAYCDMIYAVIIEELGLAGALVVLGLYLWLLLRIGYIATHCKKKYPAYLALGIGMLLGIQAFLNMSVAVGLGPVTGQALPLISKGGTSMLVSGMCIGMLLGISCSLDENDSESKVEEEQLPSPIQENQSL